MAQWFLEQYPTLLADIRDAVLRADATAAERAAHKLKAQVGSFGARRAYHAVEQIEALAGAGDLSGLKEASPELEQGLMALHGEMAEFARESGTAGARSFFRRMKSYSTKKNCRS